MALQIIGIDKLNRKFKRIGGSGGIGNPTLFYKQAIVHIDKWIKKNFETEGEKAYPGKGWKPLAPETVWARQKGWGYYKPKTIDPKILQHKGWLKGKWKVDWNRRMGIIESGVEYGEFHDQGEPVQSTKKNKQGVPQRKIIPTEKMIMPDIMKLLKFWVRGILQ